MHIRSSLPEDWPVSQCRLTHLDPRSTPLRGGLHRWLIRQIRESEVLGETWPVGILAEALWMTIEGHVTASLT